MGDMANIEQRRLSSSTHPRTCTAGLLTAEEAAEWLGVSRATFFKLPIRKVRVYKSIIRYDVRDLQMYADAHGDSDPMRRAI